MPFITPDHRDRAIGEIKLFFQTQTQPTVESRGLAGKKNHSLFSFSNGFPSSILLFFSLAYILGRFYRYLVKHF